MSLPTPILRRFLHKVLLCFGVRWVHCRVMRSLSLACFFLAVPAFAQDAMSLGRSSVSAVLDHYTINTLAQLPDTHQPLPSTGKWSIRTTRPDICPHDATPCARVLYTVPEAHVVCEWTVIPQQGTTTEAFLDENEDASRYLIRKMSATEVGPLILTNPPPVYPAIARAAHVDGTVVVRLVVSDKGDVKTVSAVSGPAMLLAATQDAAKHWTFRALQLGNEAIPFTADLNAIYTVEGKHRTDCTRDHPCFESSLPKVTVSMHP